MSEVCITITGVRKPGLNEPDFHNYLTQHHAPLALPFLLKYGIKEYNLVRIPTLPSISPHQNQNQNQN